MPSSNPFEILGVGPDVDDASLRRAYAQKIREHPPETDPEGFQRVADALEALRDPERRTRLSEALAQPELVESLRTYFELLSDGRRSEGAELLEKIIERYPDSRQARMEQIQLHRDDGLVATALDCAEKWTQSSPGEVTAWLIAAELRLEQSDLEGALADAQKAMQVAPKERTPLLLLATVYEQSGRLDEADRTLASALALDDRRRVPDTAINARRVLSLAFRSPALAEAEVEALAAAGTDDAKAELAAALSVEAGSALFDRRPQRAEVAARLYELAHRLAPSRQRFTLPACRQMPLASLKPDAREHVQEVRRTKPKRVLQKTREMTRATSIKLVVGAAALSGAFVAGSLLARSLLPEDTIRAAIGVSVFVVIGAGFAASWWLVARKPKPEEFDYLELRRLHLICVSRERVDVIPLLRVWSVVIHGGYRFEVKHDAGKLATGVDLTRSDDFANVVRAQIHRLRVLATANLLDTELEHEPLDWS